MTAMVIIKCSKSIVNNNKINHFHMNSHCGECNINFRAPALLRRHLARYAIDADRGAATQQRRAGRAGAGGRN